MKITEINGGLIYKDITNNFHLLRSVQYLLIGIFTEWKNRENNLNFILSLKNIYASA